MTENIEDKLRREKVEFYDPIREEEKIKKRKRNGTIGAIISGATTLASYGAAIYHYADGDLETSGLYLSLGTLSSLPALCHITLYIENKLNRNK